MARERTLTAGRHSFRAQFSDEDAAVLDEACRIFGVGKSELVRRLVRASVDVGPALSAEGVERIEALTGQVRMVGRNLMQVLHAIHRGDAVGITDAEPVWRGLQEMIAALDDELTAWAEASGATSASLRQRAGLVVRNEDTEVPVRPRAAKGGIAASVVSRSPRRKSASVTSAAASSSGLVPSVPALPPAMITDGFVAE